MILNLSIKILLFTSPNKLTLAQVSYCQLPCFNFESYIHQFPRKTNALSPSPPVGTIIITPDDSNSSTDHIAKLSESSSEDSASVIGLIDSVSGSTGSMNKEAWPSLSQVCENHYLYSR